MDLIKNPTWENAGWFALDVVCLIAPFVPSLGAGKILTHADNIQDAAAFVSKYDTVIALGQSMRTRIIPYADEIGASIYKGLSNYAELEMKYGYRASAWLGYFDNMSFIAVNAFNGAKFIDKGFDAGRSIQRARVLEKKHYLVKE